VLSGNCISFAEISYEITKNDSVPFIEGEDCKSEIVVDKLMIVEHVTVRFVAQHPRRGELAIALTSPFGTPSRLAELHRDTHPNYDWTFGSIANWGETSNGTWTLHVTDQAKNMNYGRLVSWTLTIYGREYVDNNANGPR
jgi:subtilisin-like proprotein convertase family protein